MKKINTLTFQLSEENIEENVLLKLSSIIKEGGTVAIPTETVYGLAANALNEEAVKKIFIAKGRPSDNPLIVHIADIEDVKKYARNIPKMAYILFEKFSPGPLTLVLKKKKNIPYVTSGGLETVALRIPNHKIALALIKKSGVPLAAPSANISGSPSPTRYEHIYKDLYGKVDALIDGGICDYGVESTVLSLVGKKPTLLRPGGVTKEQLESVLGEIIVDKAVFEHIGEGEKVSSPGMKYRHYAPKAKVLLLRGDNDKVERYLSEHCQMDDGVMCFLAEKEQIKSTKNVVSYGDDNEPKTLSKNLFHSLRKLDELNVKNIYVHCPSTFGVGLAVYNRLVKAAGFTIIDV